MRGEAKPWAPALWDWLPLAQPEPPFVSVSLSHFVLKTQSSLGCSAPALPCQTGSLIFSQGLG